MIIVRFPLLVSSIFFRLAFIKLLEDTEINPYHDVFRIFIEVIKSNVKVTKD